MDYPLLLNVSATKQETEKSGCEDLTSCKLACMERGPPCDLRARIHRQEAEAPNSVKDRRLNAQVQEEQKGDFGGRLFFFFIELKNRHIIQLLPVAPKLLAQPPDTVPLPTKSKGIRRQRMGSSEDGKCLGCQRAPVSTPAKHRKHRLKLLVPLWDWAGQGRTRRCLRASQLKHRTPCSLTEDVGLLWQEAKGSRTRGMKRSWQVPPQPDSL